MGIIEPNGEVWISMTEAQAKLARRISCDGCGKTIPKSNSVAIMKDMATLCLKCLEKGDLYDQSSGIFSMSAAVRTLLAQP